MDQVSSPNSQRESIRSLPVMHFVPHPLERMRSLCKFVGETGLFLLTAHILIFLVYHAESEFSSKSYSRIHKSFSKNTLILFFINFFAIVYFFLFYFNYFKKTGLLANRVRSLSRVPKKLKKLKYALLVERDRSLPRTCMKSTCAIRGAKNALQVWESRLIYVPIYWNRRAKMSLIFVTWIKILGCLYRVSWLSGKLKRERERECVRDIYV